MRAWLRQHRQALVRAAARVGILNTLVIGIALALPAGGYALVESVRALSGRLTLEPQISLFLDARSADADALAARLKRDPRVTTVRFVARDEALKELGAVQGVPGLGAAPGRNPLPAALVVRAAPDAIEPLAADLAKLPGVAQVQADAVWAGRLAGIARVARLAVWLLAAVLAAALVAGPLHTLRPPNVPPRRGEQIFRPRRATGAFFRP